VNGGPFGKFILTSPAVPLAIIFEQTDHSCRADRPFMGFLEQDGAKRSELSPIMKSSNNNPYKSKIVPSRNKSK
jgi:hypothetical protein